VYGTPILWFKRIYKPMKYSPNSPWLVSGGNRIRMGVSFPAEIAFLLKAQREHMAQIS
jgi:hypothetical protein